MSTMGDEILARETNPYMRAQHRLRSALIQLQVYEDQHPTTRIRHEAINHARSLIPWSDDSIEELAAAHAKICETVRWLIKAYNAPGAWKKGSPFLQPINQLANAFLDYKSLELKHIHLKSKVERYMRLQKKLFKECGISYVGKWSDYETLALKDLALEEEAYRSILECFSWEAMTDFLTQAHSILSELQEQPEVSKELIDTAGSLLAELHSHVLLEES